MRLCARCGASLSDDAAFCGACGQAAGSSGAAREQPAPQPPAAARDLSAGSRPTLCADGKYRWVYELSMFRNPIILFVIWRIFSAVSVGIWLFVMALEASDGDLDMRNGIILTGTFLLFLVGTLVLSTVAYLVYALIMGGSYCVLFEMDEQGVVHRQLARQAKKAEALAAINVLVGMATANATQAGIGILSAKSELASTFAKVRSIRALRRRNTIKVNEPFAKNQIYCEDADFDFVLDHIAQRCPHAKIRG